MDCPSSVIEGGLVAQATNCPDPNLPIGRPYCEYRDGLGQDQWGDTEAVSDNRKESVSVTVSSETGGEYYVLNASLGIVLTNASAGVPPIHRFDVPAGGEGSIDLLVMGRGNYAKAGNGTGTIVVLPPGSSDASQAIDSCDISIIDDDDSAYIGQRNHHPYGGTWRTTPHCYTHGCGWD